MLFLMQAAKYFTLCSFSPAIEILPLFSRYTWYLSIRASHCFVDRPVYENIPIWSVMCCQLPGAPMLSSSLRSILRISRILKVTISFNSVFQLSNRALSLRIVAASRAPCWGGLVYRLLIMILNYHNSYFTCDMTLSHVSLLLETM